MGPDKYIKNYIDGTLVPPNTGNYLDTVNPAKGSVYAHFPDSNDLDLQLAVEAAERAFPEWSNIDVKIRFRMLSRVADIIEQNIEIFARSEAIDTGKPFSMARSVDIPRAQEHIRHFASAVLHLDSGSYHSPREGLAYNLRQPIGVVGCITPWNYPLYYFTLKIAPALAVGNTVVAKPSQHTPMTVYLFSKACMEAGLPPGVLNIVYGIGDKVGEDLIRHPKIKAISFSGNTTTGRKVARQAIPELKKLNLSLSAKNANIVFEDCDFDDMILNTLRSSFTNNGQTSYSGSRIFVERTLYERFREEFVKRTQFLKIGDPFSSITDLGAMISLQAKEKYLSYISLAELEGGKLLCGGKSLDLQGELENGFFVRPAIIEGLPIEARFNQEEIFGPVVHIAPFDTQEEVIRWTNATPYGLAASIWTKDTTKATRLAERLDAGTIWINSWWDKDNRVTYSGRNYSGYGKEGGEGALAFFTQEKTVSVR